LTSWILTWSSLWKARNSNLVKVRVQYIVWSSLRKKDATTGVCWEKWHTHEGQTFEESHMHELKHHLHATSKSQATNK
jgi:hypothetical protein